MRMRAVAVGVKRKYWIQEKRRGRNGPNSVCIGVCGGRDISPMAACMYGSTIKWDIMGKTFLSFLDPLYLLFLNSETTQNKQLAGPAAVGSAREPSSAFSQLANPSMLPLCIPITSLFTCLLGREILQCVSLDRKDLGFCLCRLFPCLIGGQITDHFLG